jgi:tetratricopeptide (TPR) repeat protein
MELNPNAAGAWSNLGEIYVNMGLLDTAEAYLHTAVGLNPYEASAISNLGVIAIKRGDYPKARGLLMRARAILPGEPAISYNLAHTERLLGRVDKYEQYLTECARLPGAPPIVFQDLGDLYLSRQDFRKAAEVFRRGLAKGLPIEAVQQRVIQFPVLGQELGR